VLRAALLKSAAPERSLFSLKAQEFGSCAIRKHRVERRKQNDFRGDRI
jgi:hypothetical protein